MATARRPSRKALRQARSAQFLGDRRKEAETRGPSAVLAVAMDQLRSAISQLPENSRPDAAARATQLIDQLRQTLTDS
ncbi:hypothetical protein ACH4F6_31560 [Streptomyces sp. NPDC017936]|uniref:hypothetical protein n=1 Tax=Streptomyces sp. NPDC017936 TaxID=3365016 RepID=UPI0037B348EC